MFCSMLQRAHEQKAFMACDIDRSRNGNQDLKGLYPGHVYSITKVASITVNGASIKLLRLLNPWRIHLSLELQFR